MGTSEAGAAYDVFVSHAGPQKREVVSYLVGALKRKGLRVFVDFESLQLGDHAPTAMEDAARTTPVGVFVLSPDFFAHEWPVKELRIFLERAVRSQQVRLVPYFFGVRAWDDNKNLNTEEKQLLDKVSEYTGLERIAGVSFEHDQVEKLADAVTALVERIRGRSTQNEQSVSTDIPEPVPYFAGREVQVTEIAHLLQQLDNFSGRLLRVAIVGAPGMGKSQLALKAVDGLLPQFPLNARLDASDETTLRNSFSALANRFDLVWDNSHPKESEDQVLRHFMESKEPWLLIFDNVKADKEYALVLSSRLTGRPSARSAVVVTSSFAKWELTGQTWKIIKLERLEDNAVEILKTLVKDYKDDPKLADIASGLHGLPLALSVAGAHMYEYDMPPEEYLTEMQNDTDAGRDAATASVRLIIARLDERTKDILKVLSFLAPSDIPQSLLQAALKNFDAKNLAHLHNVSLISRVKDTIAMHQLLQQAVLKTLAVEDDMIVQLFNALIEQVKERGKSLQETNRRAALVPHILAAQDATADSTIVTIRKLKADINIGAAKILSRIARYKESLSLVQKAVNFTEQFLGKEHPNTADLYTEIGGLYNRLGDYAKALESHGKALTIRTKFFGVNNENTATSFSGVGASYYLLGDNDKAREFQIMALDIRMHVLGPDHYDTATSCSLVGNAYFRQGKYSTALEYYNKALDLRKRLAGMESTDTAASYQYIGNVYVRHGCYDKALEFYNVALEIRKKRIGGRSP